jgi:hypothetical protein
LLAARLLIGSFAQQFAKKWGLGFNALCASFDVIWQTLIATIVLTSLAYASASCIKNEHDFPTFNCLAALFITLLCGDVSECHHKYIMTKTTTTFQRLFVGDDSQKYSAFYWLWSQSLRDESSESAITSILSGCVAVFCAFLHIWCEWNVHHFASIGLALSVFYMAQNLLLLFKVLTTTEIAKCWFRPPSILKCDSTHDMVTSIEIDTDLTPDTDRESICNSGADSDSDATPDTDRESICNSGADSDSDATPDTDRESICNSGADSDSDATPDTDRASIEEERVETTVSTPRNTSGEDVNVSTSPTDMIADFFSWITDKLLEREMQLEGEGGGCVTTEVVGPDAV